MYLRRRFGMRPGLATIRALLGELDHPERSFPSIHVAGSKGKGSVSAIAASVLSRAAAPAGLYTSPHLQSFRERIRVDGTEIPPGQVVRGLEEVEAAAERLERRGTIEHPPTFFEMTTALGLVHFARSRVGSAAIEVGLGGEFDATNVLDARVGVLTTIELEHTEILGPTLTEVAHAKAGILHPGMRAVTGEGKPEPLREIERIAGRQGVPLWHLGREIRIEDRRMAPTGQHLTVVTPHREHPRLELPLLGEFQLRNAALAVAALDLFGEATGTRIPEAALRRGLKAVRWRGRLERIEAGPPELYLDVAHTPESAQALAASLAEIAPFLEPEDNAILFGCLAGKRVAAILDALAPLARTLIVTPIRSDRSMEVGTIKRAAFGLFPRVIVSPSAEAGLPLARAATAATGFTVATGSDYLVGELLNLLEGAPGDEPDLSDPTLRAPGREVVAARGSAPP